MVDHGIPWSFDHHLHLGEGENSTETDTKASNIANHIRRTDLISFYTVLSPPVFLHY